MFTELLWAIDAAPDFGDAGEFAHGGHQWVRASGLFLAADVRSAPALSHVPHHRGARRQVATHDRRAPTDHQLDRHHAAGGGSDLHGAPHVHEGAGVFGSFTNIGAGTLPAVMGNAGCDYLPSFSPAGQGAPALIQAWSRPSSSGVSAGNWPRLPSGGISMSGTDPAMKFANGLSAP